MNSYPYIRSEIRSTSYDPIQRRFLYGKLHLTYNIFKFYTYNKFITAYYIHAQIRHTAPLSRIHVLEIHTPANMYGAVYRSQPYGTADKLPYALRQGSRIEDIRLYARQRRGHVHAGGSRRFTDSVNMYRAGGGRRFTDSVNMYRAGGGRRFTDSVKMYCTGIFLVLFYSIFLFL